MYPIPTSKLLLTLSGSYSLCHIVGIGRPWSATLRCNLIEPNLNRQVGNAAYPDKIAAYGQSVYGITRRIADDAPGEWNLARLEARQERMAQRAVHLRRADFA